jgi:hypothetical protein
LETKGFVVCPYLPMGTFCQPVGKSDDRFASAANAINPPDLYERNKVVVISAKILVVEGTLQNQDGVVSVKASVVRHLAVSAVDVRSHDFY